MLAFSINPWNINNLLSNNTEIDIDLSQMENIRHESNLWELAKSNKFTDIFQSVVTNGKNIDSIAFNIFIPEGESYWLRVTRRFSNPSLNHTLTPVECKGRGRENNAIGILTNNSIVIERPSIFIDEAEFKNPDLVDFEVRSSMFRGINTGHVYTHWIFTALDDSIIFQSLYDRYNKTSIRLTKSNDLMARSSFKIHCIHVGINGIESVRGTKVVQNNELGFDLKGSFRNVDAFKDLDIFINPPNGRNAIINAWFMRGGDGGDVDEKVDITPLEGDDKITIPGHLLNFDKNYSLTLYCYNNAQEAVNMSWGISTKGTTDNDYEHNKEYKYQKAVRVFDDQTLFRYTPPSGFSIEEMPNGDILIPNRDLNKLVVFRTNELSTQDGLLVNLDFGNNFQGTKIIHDITLLGSNLDNILIKPINKNLVLIDTYNNKNQPTFMVYRFDPVRENFSLVAHKVRNSESVCLGFNNNIVKISENEFWYLPPLQSIVLSYNIARNSIDFVVDLKRTSFQTGTMFFNRIKGKIVLFNGSGGIVVLDPETRVLEQSRSVPFKEWNNSTIKAQELGNGDYLLFNIRDTQSENNLAYYECENNTYTPIPNTANLSMHTGTILTKSGHLFQVTGNEASVLTNKMFKLMSIY